MTILLIALNIRIVPRGTLKTFKAINKLGSCGAILKYCPKPKMLIDNRLTYRKKRAIGFLIQRLSL